MTALIRPFPDAELLLLVGMTPVLQGIFGSGGVRVVTILPAEIAVPTVRIKRISGAGRSIAIDRPIVDVDVFASDYQTASLIGRRFEAQLKMLRGVQLSNGVISNVNVIQGPRWLPESDPNLFRSGASYEVFTHA